MSDPVHIARSKIANAVLAKEPEREHEARCEMTAAKLGRQIDAAVYETDHPLTPEAMVALAQRLISLSAQDLIGA